MCRIDSQVKESLDYVVAAHHLGHLGHQIFANLLSGVLGLLAAHLQEGEYYQRQLPFKLSTCLLQLYHAGWHLLSV